jgi:hypothetical protein
MTDSTTTDTPSIRRYVKCSTAHMVKFLNSAEKEHQHLNPEREVQERFTDLRKKPIKEATTKEANELVVSNAEITDRPLTRSKTQPRRKNGQ